MNYYGLDNSPSYLAHYGKKGMRWGVRKNRERTARDIRQLGVKGANQRNYERNIHQKMATTAAQLGGIGAGIYTVAKAKSRKGVAAGLALGAGSNLAAYYINKHNDKQFRENSRQINGGKVKRTGYTPVLGTGNASRDKMILAAGRMAESKSKYGRDSKAYRQANRAYDDYTRDYHKKKSR